MVEASSSSAAVSRAVVKVQSSDVSTVLTAFTLSSGNGG